MSTGKSTTSPATLAARQRSHLRIARYVGGGLWLSGGLLLLVGAALPWVKVTVLDTDLSLPGIALGWGTITGGVGLAALSALRGGPRGAVLFVVLGLAVAAGAGQAQREAGRAVRREILRVQVALAPVNERLARVALPPVEPFRSVRPATEYVGKGPAVTLVGGGALALGAAILFAAGRMRRTCFSCGVFWASSRLGDIRHCPACGVETGPAPAACSRCWFPITPGDHYCVRCGDKLETTG